MLARNADKGQIETFALSRFRGIEAAGSTFTRPADFDAQRYARQAFGITSDEKPIKVRLLFEPKLVYVAERKWHPGQKLKHRADGRVEMRLETTGRKELDRWVLSWIPDVKVLAPMSLRLIGFIFRKAQNKIQDPAKLRRLIADLIDKEEWSSLGTDVKGDAYEGLLQKNAEDVKGGAGLNLSAVSYSKPQQPNNWIGTG